MKCLNSLTRYKKGKNSFLIIFFGFLLISCGGDSIDNDGNGLIEISTLRQLHNMRYNLKGTSYKDNSNATGNTSGCPNSVCRGYELTRDLDFDQDKDGSTWSTSDADNNGTIEYTLDAGDNAEPYFVVDPDGSGGWKSIGTRDIPFQAVFEGNGNTIKNLAMRSNLQYLGMFGAIGASADISISNLGLVANLADYTGASNSAIYIGGLVGRQEEGSITDSYTTGAVAGGAGEGDRVGGLVGWQNGGSITASYATGAVAGGDGEGDRVGGLVGWQDGGSITASYATGGADGGDDNNDIAGGLVGEQSNGNITSSYATGAADGGAGAGDSVGGLVGAQIGGSMIIASYATGTANGGAGAGDSVGGLVGAQIRGSMIIASYATGGANGGIGEGDIVGGLVGFPQGGSIIASYSFGQITNAETSGDVGNAKGNATMSKDITADIPSWNSAAVNTFRAWDFTTDQPPALKYADYDGTTDGSSTFACVGSDNTATDANTIYLPYCGIFLPGQGRSPVGGASTTNTILGLKFRKQGLTPVGGASATGTSETLGHFALVDKNFDGYIEISNLVTLGNIIYNPQGTSYKTSTASKGITSGCPGGVCRGYELTRSFSTTELESGGVDHYLRNVLTQDAVIKSNGYSIADIYLLGIKANKN